MKKIFIGKEFKRLWKPFLFFFVASFMIINWNNIHPVFYYFHYRVVLAKISPFFEWLEPQGIEAIFFNKENITKKESIIEIPKIGIKAPIGFAKKENGEDFDELLKKGGLYYPGSALPGEEGTTIILGHSAPPEWPKINYDWIFSDLKELEKRDRVYIYFNHQRYIYEVENKFFLEKDEEVPKSNLTNYKSGLVLLSCWPPGKNQKRIAVEAEMIRY